MRSIKIIVFGAFLSFSIFGTAAAQEKSAAGPALKPITDLLNPTGALKLQQGLTESFDPKGFRMIAEAGKPPRFVPASESLKATDDTARRAATGAGFWASRFTIVGASDLVKACIVINGILHVGGDFTCIGGISANHIAKWNGSSWSALGSGTNNTVWAMAVAGSNLYAGVLFLSPEESRRITSQNGKTRSGPRSPRGWMKLF